MCGMSKSTVEIFRWANFLSNFFLQQFTTYYFVLFALIPIRFSPIFTQWCSLSPTPRTPTLSLHETQREPTKCDENEILCNSHSPRLGSPASARNISPLSSLKRDSPTAISLIDDLKKLEIRTTTSSSDLSKLHKSNSPLASSSNLSKQDPSIDNLRLLSQQHNNNENNICRKPEAKWHCSVSVYFDGFWDDDVINRESANWSESLECPQKRKPQHRTKLKLK